MRKGTEQLISLEHEQQRKMKSMIGGEFNASSFSFAFVDKANQFMEKKSKSKLF